MNRDFDPPPAFIELHCCEYRARCGAPRCRVDRATVIVRKMDAAGRFIRQIELCDRHAKVLAEREGTRGLELVDERARHQEFD